MAGFFNYFPTISYGSTPITNVIAKVRFRDIVSREAAVFYTYTVEEGERPDQIASNYYGESTYDWLVYLCNDITDPYHEWPKSQKVADEYIVQKYGSIANAQLQTAFYRVNPYEDDSITTAAYDALTSKQKKYWKPSTNYMDEVVGYTRKEIDFVYETNAVVGLTGTFDVQIGSVIKQGSDVFGTVASANSSYVVLKHTTGTWAANTDTQVALSNTAANATITTVTTLPGGIPSEELVYWSPVSMYEYEMELNEERKNIRLVHTSLVDQIEREMRDILEI